MIITVGGEAEYDASLKSAAAGLGVRRVAAELGVGLEVTLKTDGVLSVVNKLKSRFKDVRIVKQFLHVKSL